MMKIAVIGCGIDGLYAAQYFDELGASVVFFCHDDRDKVLELKSVLSKNSSCPSFIRAELELSKYNNSLLHLDRLLEWLKNFKGQVINKKINRIHKRFISKNEVIKGHSRLFDLFRIVYQGQFSEEIEKQKADNPEVFSKLEPHMIASLKDTLESFVDVDLVIDTREYEKMDGMMGPGGVSAINEKILNCSNVYYGQTQVLKNYERLISSDKIVIVGQGIELIYTLLLLLDGNENTNKTIRVITEKNNIWELPLDLNQDEKDFYKERIERLISWEQRNWDSCIEKFADETFKWRELEDYERAKIPAPVLPARVLEIYHNATATSLDKLIDKEELFVTYEVPAFRSEENEDHLKTLAADAIVVLQKITGDHLQLEANMKKPFSKKADGNDLEPGFYHYRKDQNLSLQDIEKDIMNYFGKRDA